MDLVGGQAMHMKTSSMLSWFTLAALAGLGCSQAATGSGGGAGGGSAWDCGSVPVPLGQTTECTSSTHDAVTYDGTSSDDGPAYYCPPDSTSADCPPVSTAGGAGTQDGAGGAGGAATGGTGSGGTSDGTSGGGAANGGTTSDGATTGGSKPAPTPPSDGAGGKKAPSDGGGSTTGKGGTSDGTSGGGAASGTSTGTSTGTSDGTAGGASTGDGFYCTRELGKRTCKKAPTCNPGAHRVQMDCEPDGSFGDGNSSNESCYPGAGGGDGAMPGGHTDCFYPSGGASPSAPAATAEYTLEAFNGAQVLHVRLTFTPTFVDNSYGTTAVGWSKGHAFSELVGSDHAELTFLDTAGAEKLHFKMDYISKSATAPSGYACLGVTGGEGRMILGDASSVVRTSTSLDKNLNDRGYGSFIVDSPATSASYAPSASAPAWDYRVIYEAWIKNDAFGAAGFGSVQLAFVHASPSKLGTNTLPVSKGTCPPDWNGASSSSSSPR